MTDRAPRNSLLTALMHVPHVGKWGMIAGKVEFKADCGTNERSGERDLACGGNSPLSANCWRTLTLTPHTKWFILSIVSCLGPSRRFSWA